MCAQIALPRSVRLAPNPRAKAVAPDVKLRESGRITFKVDNDMSVEMVVGGTALDIVRVAKPLTIGRKDRKSPISATSKSGGENGSYGVGNDGIALVRLVKTVLTAMVVGLALSVALFFSGCN